MYTLKIPSGHLERSSLVRKEKRVRQREREREREREKESCESFMVF